MTLGVQAASRMVGLVGAGGGGDVLEACRAMVVNHPCFIHPSIPEQWTTNISLPQISAGTVTIIAPHKALKIVVPGILTSGERSVVHHVDSRFIG